MKKIQKYIVRPNIPKSLKPLLEIAYNLWWTWNPEAIDLFRWIDNEKWEEYDHNPVKMLGSTTPERFTELENDISFNRHLDKVASDLRAYMKKKSWFEKSYKKDFKGPIAYFSFEFGLHESIRLYSGGLGILSGDHLKSASDLGIPLVGVGLIYRFGYFQQYLNIDGWQQEYYQENDYEDMPMKLVKDDEDKPVLVALELPGRVVYMQIWKIQVGRVALYLLDTDLEMNSPEDKELTYKLYGGDMDTRIQQEILLGIGGMRALNVMGIEPSVSHMNEGHSAFLVFERTRRLMEANNLSFEEARDIVSASSLFTTHTPVPAGIDVFPPDKIATYFSEYAHHLGLNIHDILRLGRQNPDNQSEYFSMPVLAFNFSDRSNGVSMLHGKVSRDMWRSLWPDLPDKLMPLRHITNGIHTPTWLSGEMMRLYDRHLGPQMIEDAMDSNLWDKVDNIPDTELWWAKERLRERLVTFARKKITEQMKRRGSIRKEVLSAEEILDPRALTIGFARRFATYKRATLIFKDVERIKRLLNDRDRPVQIILAGKSHPKDNEGKEFIRKIVHIANQEEFRRKVVFLEDYNMDIARHLVQGVDIWLNTPRRPLEASGTSGMKVCPNGGINLSVLDGWWVEGYNGQNGWSIGGEVYEDHQYQDDIEALALYEILEKEVVPTFYERGVDGVPREWIKLMKNSIKTVSPFFNTNRMVSEYFIDVYQPAEEQYKELAKKDFKAVHELQSWKHYIMENWNNIYVESVYAEQKDLLLVGSDLEVMAYINLGNAKPDDFKVALFHGQIGSSGDISGGVRLWMKAEEDLGDGRFIYKVIVPLDSSGHRGYSVCVYPDTKKQDRRFEKAHIKWWQG